MTAKQVIAVDLGGTHIRVAVIDEAGEIISRDRTPTSANDGPDAVIGRIADLVTRIARDAGVPDAVEVGVASPGPLNPRSGIVHYTPNLPGWRDVPLIDKLQDRVQRPVTLANDGNAAALGEARFGSARNVRNLVYLALGTGIGGGVISEGVLIDGKNGLGAEVGHTLVAMDGPRCSCGSIGCLESFAAGWALQRDGEAIATTADGDTLREVASDGPVHAGVIKTAAERGDVAAIAILDRAGRAIGAAIGSLINLFDPDMVVIGGGVAALGELLIGPARKAVPSHSFMDMRRGLEITYSTLGADTGLYGAAALALRDFTHNGG